VTSLTTFDLNDLFHKFLNKRLNEFLIKHLKKLDLLTVDLDGFLDNMILLMFSVATGGIPSRTNFLEEKKILEVKGRPLNS
jgi:hypothetical protein